MLVWGFYFVDFELMVLVLWLVFCFLLFIGLVVWVLLLVCCFVCLGWVYGFGYCCWFCVLIRVLVVVLAFLRVCCADLWLDVWIWCLGWFWLPRFESDIWLFYGVCVWWLCFLGLLFLLVCCSSDLLKFGFREFICWYAFGNLCFLFGFAGCSGLWLISRFWIWRLPILLCGLGLGGWFVDYAWWCCVFGVLIKWFWNLGFDICWFLFVLIWAGA